LSNSDLPARYWKPWKKWISVQENRTAFEALLEISEQLDQLDRQLSPNSWTFFVDPIRFLKSQDDQEIEQERTAGPMTDADLCRALNRGTDPFIFAAGPSRCGISRTCAIQISCIGKGTSELRVIRARPLAMH
jgi:hypothetical protein